jgi:hypothetical protein
VARRGKKARVWLPAEWAPILEAFEHVEAFGSRSRVLAERDLLGELEAGRLVSTVRLVARDGKEVIEDLPPAFWKRPGLRLVYLSAERTGQARAGLRVDGCPVFKVDGVPAGVWFFIRRAELDRLYPAASAAPSTVDEPEAAKPHERPGTKPTGDWPTVLAAWLVKIARDEPRRLKNLDKLTEEASGFLIGKIKWAPKDSKQIRERIKDYLQFVRG